MATTIDKVPLTPRKAIVLTGKHAVLIAASLIALFPLLLIVSTALKTSDDVMLNPFGLFSSFSMENLETAWNVGGFSNYVVNSLLLAVPSTLLVVVLSTTAGYAFARLPFPGRKIVFNLVVTIRKTGMICGRIT